MGVREQVEYLLNNNPDKDYCAACLGTEAGVRTQDDQWFSQPPMVPPTCDHVAVVTPAAIAMAGPWASH